MSSEQDEERPYSEAQWEALFRQSDLKAAKFGELLETLRDEPDHELIIAREMGWTWLVEALEAQAAGKSPADDDPETQVAESSANLDQLAADDDVAPSDEANDATSSDLDDEWLADDDDDDDDEDDDDDSDDFWLDAFEDEADGDDESGDSPSEPWERRHKRLSRIPAYAAARALAKRVSDALRPLMEGEDPDDDRSRLLGEAYISAHQAAVKIAGGHAMGYDDDVLCGNIVNNRIALEAAERCQQAWAELQEQQIISREMAEPLVPEMRAVQRLIKERIAELRSRVWW